MIGNYICQFPQDLVRSRVFSGSSGDLKPDFLLQWEGFYLPSPYLEVRVLRHVEREISIEI